MLWWHWGQCPQHQWETSLGTCPYGSNGVFEVTWPSIELARSYNKTHGWDFEPSDAFLGICIAFSYVPYLIIFKCVFAFLLKRGTRELSVLLFFVIACSTAELMVLHTKLLPPEVQKRPEQSCITSCGMPSSKSAIAIGCFILRFLDNLTRSRPSSLLSIFPQRATSLRGEGRPTSSDKIMSLLYEAGGAGVPLAAWDEVIGDTHVAFLALWMMLLLPVPMAVVQLRDNTMQQAFYGAFSGFGVAVFWTLVTRVVQHRYNQHLGVTLLGFIRHNLALPCFMAERRCSEGNKTALVRGPSLAASWVGGSAQSARPDRELQWYLDQTNRRRTLLSSFGVGASEYLEERAARLEDIIKGLTKEARNTLPLSSSSATMASSMTAS